MDDVARQVVSWDEVKGTVDSNHEDGRSYISALSEVYDNLQTCNGTAKVNTPTLHVRMHQNFK